VPHGNNKWRKAVTRISEFINVKIEKLVSLAFNIRDIRSLCKFADKHNTAVTLYFKAPKSPLFSVVDIPGLCEAVFTISTSSIQGIDTGEGIQKMIPEVTL
jgi:cystathionine beta-lyase/cystathionine gamma-synthase